MSCPTPLRCGDGNTGIMTTARALFVPADSAGFYHCVSRCVRRAFLCGEDRYTGQSFEHRKDWLEQRLTELASIFAVALYGFAVMSNHVHVVLQVDPIAATHWTDAEVARRWCRLFPRRGPGGHDEAARIDHLQANPERLLVLRARLGNLSWFMRCLSEPIARRANIEDHCTGRFWEGRFKCQVLLDEPAVIAALAYVDLNPVRAGLADRLEHSRHTSIVRRLVELDAQPVQAGSKLQPLLGLSPSPVLSITTAQYIELVDCTGRQWHPGKRGVIAIDAPAALARLGLSADRWNLQVRAVGSTYWRAIGDSQALIDKATAIGQRWLKGVRFAIALELI